MKTNANKSAAGAAFPSTRLSAPARSLGATRARLAGHVETRSAPEKRLKAVAPAARTVSARTVKSKAQGGTDVKPVKPVKAAAKTRTRVLGRAKPVRSSLKAATKRGSTRKVVKAVKAVNAKAANKHTTTGKSEHKQASLKTAVQQASELRGAVLRGAQPGLAHVEHVENDLKAPAQAKPTMRASRAVAKSAVIVAAQAQAPQAPAAGTPVRSGELRSAPSVAPSATPTHAGRGDATLARYMSELASYELLGREDEIRLAQEVEALEIAYWRALLGMPRAWDMIEPVIRQHLEEPPSELPGLAKAAHAASAPAASKVLQTRFERAVERTAVQLRAVDIHRDAAKGTYRVIHELAESAPRGSQAKQLQTFTREVEGARRAQQAAKDRFVAANLRLVVSMARRYAREGRMPLADLIQEGNLGLMKAVERFDHRRGFRFSTYASWWIRHALTRGLADKGRLVRLPVHALETRTRLARATRKLTCRTGVPPTLAELAAETGLAPEKLPAMEELSTEAPFSLDAPVSGDNDRTFLDMLRYEDQTSAEESVVTASHKESLASLMGELSPFEAQILRYRYGFDGGEERTLKEIGQMYNLSRERIRQIQASALAKMRSRVEDADQERAAL